MKVLFVVQRYGEDFAGGAEAATRFLAEGLAQRSHDVTVLTSCARSSVDWADHYRPGASVLNGVEVHRLRVRAPKDAAAFGLIHRDVVHAGAAVSLASQRAWARANGPDLEGYGATLASLARANDLTVFYAYMFAPTVFGLPIASAVAPVAFHPALHDEPAARLSMFDSLLRLPDGVFFHTIEETELFVRKVGHLPRLARIIGLGVEPPAASDDRALRRSIGLEHAPYIVSVGRIEASKGSVELLDYFTAFKERNPSDLELVLVGDDNDRVGARTDVRTTGFVDEELKHSALAGASALVQPSYFESFSLVLLEGWLHRLPAVVQGRNPVLTGQVRRSNGGLPYAGFASFEATLQRVLADPVLAERIGRAGFEFTTKHYEPSVVLDRYEEFMDITTRAGRARLGR